MNSDNRSTPSDQPHGQDIRNHRLTEELFFLTSGSGLDPDFRSASAISQAACVAMARGIPSKKVQQLIAKYTHGREFAFLGEPHVNVLELYLALDRQFPRH